MTEDDFSRPEIRYILKSAKTGHSTVAVNIRECACTYYRHRNWIDEIQYDAAMIFRDTFEASQVWALPEIGKLIEGEWGRISHAKQVFPGALVTAVHERFNDDIPF